MRKKENFKPARRTGAGGGGREQKEAPQEGKPHPKTVLGWPGELRQSLAVGGGKKKKLPAAEGSKTPQEANSQ